MTSGMQLRRWWETPPATASVLPNGIDETAWRFRASGGSGAVWVGRITPTKAPELAIWAARAAGVPITLFGPVEHLDHFEEKVRPHLSADLRYGGHLSSTELHAELGRFDVMAFTPMWDEPFGLVAIEAMACGVPVAYFDSGAAGEVVGPCGAEALAEALGRAMRVDRSACRARVLERFTLDRMIDGFERLYRRAIAGAAPTVTSPLATEQRFGPAASLGRQLRFGETRLQQTDHARGIRIGHVVALLGQREVRRSRCADLHDPVADPFDEPHQAERADPMLHRRIAPFLREEAAVGEDGSDVVDGRHVVPVELVVDPRARDPVDRNALHRQALGEVRILPAIAHDPDHEFLRLQRLRP